MFGLSKPTPSHKCVLETLQLDFAELIQAKQMIDAEVAKRSADEIEETKSRLAAMAASMGTSIGALFGIATEHGKKKHRKKREGKNYKNPETGEEWHGLGKQPVWLKEKLEAGHAKEEFLSQEHAP